jgi:hypothetical protein
LEQKPIEQQDISVDDAHSVFSSARTMISRANNQLTSNSIAYDGSTIVGPESFTNAKLKPSNFLDPDAKRSESQLKYAKSREGEL